MKIHVVCNLGTREFGSDALTEGVHEVSDALGSKLIKRRLAVEIVPERPEDDKPAAAVESKLTTEPKPVSSAQTKPATQAAAPAKSK